MKAGPARVPFLVTVRMGETRTRIKVEARTFRKAASRALSKIDQFGRYGFSVSTVERMEHPTGDLGMIWAEASEANEVKP